MFQRKIETAGSLETWIFHLYKILYDFSPTHDQVSGQREETYRIQIQLNFQPSS